MPNELTLDEKIAQVRAEIDSPYTDPEDREAALCHLACLIAQRDRLRNHQVHELNAMYALPDERYPHFMLLRNPTWKDVAKAVIKKLLRKDDNEATRRNVAKAAHAYRKARGLE